MTDETKFRLLAAFKKMRQQIDMSDFNARLVFQKQTYLLQELGLQLGNTYGWYIRGPYSSDAASDGFQLTSIQDHVKYLPKLSRDELQSLKTFEKLFSESKKRFKGKSDAYVLELLGSLHFLLKYGYPRPTNNKVALKRFFELKPGFKEDAETALELLEKHGLTGF
jgi:hypothetical protein